MKMPIHVTFSCRSSRLAAPLAIALAFAICGCAPSEENVATIGTEAIPAKSFYHRLELEAGPRVLQQMVSENVDLAFARSLGVFPTDAQIQKKLDEVKRQPNFDQQLKASRKTTADLKREVTVILARQNVIIKGINVDADEIKAFYDRNVSPNNPQAKYHQPETVQIAVIMTPSEALAKEAQAQLAKNVPFANVAQAFSRDPSASNGGLLAPISRGKLDPAKFPQLEDKVFAMKPGDQLPIFEMNNAWWIIRCAKRNPEATTPFDQVKDECELGAKLEKGMRLNGSQIQSDLKEFKANHPIKGLSPDYKDLIQE